MNILKKMALVIFTFLLLFNSSIRATAISSATESGIIKVNHVAGLFEKISEKISLMLKFNQEDKADYYQELLDKRLAEIEFVTENGQGDLIEETSSRYATYLSTVSDFIISNKINNKKDSVLKTLEEHLKVLESIQSNFEFESGWWILIQHDINLVKDAKNKINNL